MFYTVILQNSTGVARVRYVEARHGECARDAIVREFGINANEIVEVFFGWAQPASDWGHVYV